MPEISFFQLLEKTRNKQEKFPFIILYGFNEFLGEKIIASLVENFLEKKSEFNYRRYYFDGEDESNWMEIIEEARSSSFFIESRKIIIVTIREEKRINLNKNDKEILETYLKAPNHDSILVVFVSLNLMKDEFRMLKKQKIDNFTAELNYSQTFWVNLDKISEREVKFYIKDYLKERSISITSSALERIIELKGDDFISVLNQLPKFEIFNVEEKSLDTEDVDIIISGIESHSIWDLSEAIENGDVNRYQKILKYLFINSINPSFIIATLINYYNKIYTAKFLLKYKFPIVDIGKVLQQPGFILNKFINSVKGFSEQKLRRILKLVYELDYQAKTSGEDIARLSLQNFIFQVKFLSSTG